MANMQAHMADWSRPRFRWAAELKRFFTSPHCRDLLVITIAAVVLALPAAIRFATIENKEIAAALIAAILAIVAWAFQSANVRFGAADIFASEILTLCRIARVIDFIQRLLDGYKPGGKPISPGKSTQDYVVIFHNNSKDLEILDGNAVYWVTEFYVYFKAMLDAMSRLPDRSDNKEVSDDKAAQYKEQLLSVIYMAFLAFESGRLAVMRLIDNKDMRQEAVLTALLNEIPAYLLLREAFNSSEIDIRTKLINGRFPNYQTLMQQIAPLAERPVTDDLPRHRIHELAKEVITKWGPGFGTTVSA
jgi:hypothetical protein